MIREINSEYGKISKENVKRASKYIVLTGNDDVDYASIQSLEMLRKNIKKGISNDISKFSLSESYKTEIVWSINCRSLQNFLELRLDKSALWEIQDLGCEIIKSLPKDHLFMYEDIVKEKINGNERIAKLIEIFD